MSTNTKILITGTRGFIGSHTTRAFTSAGYQVQPFQGNITSKENWKANLSHDQIIYLIAGVRTESSTDFDVNSDSVLRMFDALLEANLRAHKIVLASSQAVYMGNSAPFFETDIPKAATIYAKSKLAGERNLQSSCAETNTPFVILRYSTVLGPGVREKSRMSGPLYAWWRSAVQGEPISVFQDGSQTRDYIHIDDIVQANLRALTLPDGIYNVGGGKRVKVRDLAQMVKDATVSSSPILIKGGESTDFDPREMLSSIDTLKKFGWSPQKSIESSVYSFVKSQRL